jgi:fucose permease
VIVALGGYAALGMPGAAFAVAWPSVARELDRSLGDLGVVLLIGSVFGLLAASLTGRLIERVGPGLTLMVAAWVEAMAVVALAAAGSWSWVLVAVAVQGTAVGTLDSAYNTFAALELSPSAMNLLHAGFGVGATLGPWLMAAFLARDLGWRPAMLAVAGLVAVIAGAVSVTRRRWSIQATDHHPREGLAPAWGARHLVILVLFFLFSGVEIATGQWAYTLLHEGRGIAPGLAGLAAGGFFAGLTGSRLLLGLAGAAAPVRPVLAGSLFMAVLALALLVWSPVVWVGPVALVLAGAGIGPLFPLHTSLTPARFGRMASARLVSYQVGAAGAGVAIVPWAVGRLVDSNGVGAIEIALLAAGLTMGAVGLTVHGGDRSVTG